MTSVAFASLLAYTPYSRDAEGHGTKPREAKGMVKGARPAAMRRVALRCEERVDTDFRGFFRRDCTLVPVPPSSPPRAHDTLWPGLAIAEALLAKGLGREVRKLLVRSRPVPRAHRQTAENRPKFRELVNSLEWQGDLGSDLGRIILVDDVVTRGTTFLSAQAVIHKAHPWLDVVGFAAARTMSFEIITEPLAPVMGTITLAETGWGNRVP